ncbi:MAG: OmpH family outer membrane protein [Bacteroidota bacterium]
MNSQNNAQSSSVLSKITLALASLSFVGLFILFLTLYPDHSKIAYVRTDEILNKYQGMIEARSAFQVKAGDWQAKVDTLKAELEASVKDYEAVKVSLTSQTRAEREKSLQAQQDQLYRYSQAVSKKAEEEDHKLTEGVLSQINALLEVYGKEHGYSVIFGANGTGSIVYGNEAKDLTNEVLIELNRSYEGY